MKRRRTLSYRLFRKLSACIPMLPWGLKERTLISILRKDNQMKIGVLSRNSLQGLCSSRRENSQIKRAQQEKVNIISMKIP